MLHFLHALTGCDNTSFFSGTGKKSAYGKWDTRPELTTCVGPISRAGTNLAQPMHVPGGGLGLSLVGSLSGLSFLEQQKHWNSWFVVGAQKTVQESVHAARGDLCVQPGANVDVEEHVMGSHVQLADNSQCLSSMIIFLIDSTMDYAAFKSHNLTQHMVLVK